MSSETPPTRKSSSLTEERVAAFLAEQPDFFTRHPKLLESIQLPHESGQAVSLIERQVSVLRDRNIEMRHRLSNLLESARANDKLFEKTKRLVLAILEARDLASTVDTLYNSLRTDYQLEYYNLILLENSKQIPVSEARVVGLDEAHSQVGTLLRNNRAICGILRPDETAFLFGEDGKNIGSVAAVPLSHGHTFGILAVGNSDPKYYRSSMGTLFLSYIADILNRVIPRLIT